MERKELITKNAEGMRDQAKALENHASSNVRVLVVANPANTNTLVAMKSAPSIPPKNFTCLTRLDQERLRGFVVKKLNEVEVSNGVRVLPSDIEKVFIFGNHSTTQVPYIQSATVKVRNQLMPIASYFSSDETEDLISRVQNRGAAVIQAQQASSALSAAAAIASHLRDWISPITTDVTFSMGMLSDGNPYGIPDGLVFSFPCCHSESGEIKIIPNFNIDDKTKDMLQLSVNELCGEKADAETILGSLTIETTSKL